MHRPPYPPRPERFRYVSPLTPRGCGANRGHTGPSCPPSLYGSLVHSESQSENLHHHNHFSFLRGDDRFAIRNPLGAAFCGSTYVRPASPTYSRYSTSTGEVYAAAMTSVVLLRSGCGRRSPAYMYAFWMVTYVSFAPPQFEVTTSTTPQPVT